MTLSKEEKINMNDRVELYQNITQKVKIENK